MNNLIKIVTFFSILISLTSCKSEREIRVEVLTTDYVKFVDSVANITTQDVSNNWSQIEKYFYKKLKELNFEADLLENDYSFDARINAATAKYENLKKSLIKKKVIIDKENEDEPTNLDKENYKIKYRNQQSDNFEKEDLESAKSVSQ
ncbi:hypothetical protein [Flavobacterium sp.]|uniref:hypothetical protein n=1 Tax=Flavobacterium sp. TaxID=239 RepID=UPI00375113A1